MSTRKRSVAVSGSQRSTPGRPKRKRKPTLRAQQMDTECGEVPLMSDGPGGTQQRAGVTEPGQQVGGGRQATQVRAGGPHVEQPSQQRAGGVATLTPPPQADMTNSLLLQLMDEVKSMRTKLDQQEETIKRLKQDTPTEPLPSSSGTGGAPVCPQLAPAPGTSFPALGEVETPLQVGVSGSQQPQRRAQPRSIIMAGMPLGHSLPQKVKDDIWSDRYVDMAVLLYPDTHTTYGVHLAGDGEDGQGSGELRLTQHKKKIASINEWSKAFSTFISVYIQRPGREGDATELLLKCILRP